MRNTTDDAIIAGCFVSGYWAISSGVSDEAIITCCKRSLAGEDKDKGSVELMHCSTGVIEDLKKVENIYGGAE